MLTQLQRGFYDAKRLAIPFAVVTGILAFGVLIAAFVTVTLVSNKGSDAGFADQTFPPKDKLIGTVEALACVHTECPEAENATAFLNVVVADSATFQIADTAPMVATKTPENWRTVAAKVLGESDGAAVTVTSETALNVEFLLGGRSFVAAFTQEGQDQMLSHLKEVPGA